MSMCIGTQARERSAVVVVIAGRKLSVLILDLTSFSSLLSSSFRSGALFDEEDKDDDDAGWLFVSESFSRICVVLFIVSSMWVMLYSFKRTSRMCL